MVGTKEKILQLHIYTGDYIWHDIAWYKWHDFTHLHIVTLYFAISTYYTWKCNNELFTAIKYHTCIIRNKIVLLGMIKLQLKHYVCHK